MNYCPTRNYERGTFSSAPLPRLAVFFAALLLLLSGCKKSTVDEDPQTGEQRQELEDIRDMVNLYREQHKRAPARLVDLRPYAIAFPAGYQALEQGRCVLLWNEQVNPGSKSVLAYPTSALERGGPVLLRIGVISTRTAEELRAEVPSS